MDRRPQARGLLLAVQVLVSFALCFATFGASVARAAEPLAFEASAASLGGPWCPTERRRITVTLRNIGTQTWDPKKRDRLSYHWLTPDGSVVVRDGVRTELPHAVSPGETVEVEASLVAPPRRGSFGLLWAMVRDGERWYPLGSGSSTEVVVRGEPPPLQWAIEAVDVPEVAAKGTATANVTLINRGGATWSQRYGDALSYHWLDEHGETVVAEGLRTPLPLVEPGERVTVQAKLVGGPEPGPAELVFELVRENVTWFGNPLAGDPSIDVELGPAALAWSLVDTQPLDPLHAGDVLTTLVRLRNEGTEAWSAGGNDRFSYRWLPEGEPSAQPVEGMRTVLPRDVAPGETVELHARLAAPDEPGRYALAWEPVREGVTWYGPPASGEEPRIIEIAPRRLAWSLVELEPPLLAWVGRHDTVGVTVRNDGSSTWSPNRHDRLSYRWFDEAGELVPLEGLRTELPRDVAPGETIEVDMRVLGPPSPGSYRLEIELVREHVAWFGPPRQGEPSVQLTVRPQAAALGVSLLAAIVVLVVTARRLAAGTPRQRAIVAAIEPLVWPAWLAIVAWLVSEVFSDLSGIEFWEGGRPVAASCGAIIGLGIALLPQRFRPTIAVPVAVFLSLLGVADLAYQDFFGSLVPLSALGATHHLWDAGGSVASLIRPSFAWMMLLPLTGLPLALGMPRVTASPRRSRWRANTPAAVLLLCSLPGLLALTEMTTSPRGNRVFSEAQNAGQLGLVGAHLFQIARALSQLSGPEPLDDERRRAVTELYAQRVHERSAAPAFGAAQGMNVIVIQVEALQSWAVGAEIDGQPVTPFLDRASSRALVFDRIYDQTAQGRTSDAEYLVLSSNHALPEGALSFLRADAGFVTMAQALRDRGYTTLSAHPYRRGFWNRAVLHPRYGFSTSLFRRELGTGPIVGWGLADGPFLDRMADHLAQTPEPFFAFLITLSLHHPYPEFPAGLAELQLGELAGTSVGNYLQAMRHFDTALAGLFERLEETGLAERTVVAIYGDHVTGLGDTPDILELAEIPRWDPSVPMRMHRVPLFVWIPGADGDLLRKRSRVGGQIDIGPTLLHLLGVQAPGSFTGRVLTGGPEVAVLPDGSAIGPDRMLVRRGPGIGPQGRCFDLPEGTPRPREDCAGLEAAAERELSASRAVLDHDLFDELR